MFVTGVAPSPLRIRERNSFPSGELVYLAKKALRRYQADALITSLNPGWEQALAKAAIELEIPYTVAIPFPNRECDWPETMHHYYLDLLARSNDAYQVSDHYVIGAMMEANFWRADRSDLVLALWEYEFAGETFEVMDYAMQKGKQVLNLWEDWRNLFQMRRQSKFYNPAHHSDSRKGGAQVFRRD